VTWEVKVKQENLVINSDLQTEEKALLGRRQFLKASATGTALGALGVATLPGVATAKVLEDNPTEAVSGPKVTLHENFPGKISSSYKRFKQKNTVFSQCLGLQDMELAQKARTFGEPDFHEDKPGLSQLDYSLFQGAWGIEDTATMGSKFGIPNSGWYSWRQKSAEEREGPFDHNYVSPQKFAFKSKQQASDALKRAARFYGAALVGITNYNPMWEYEKLYVAPAQQEIGWEGFPFKPKSVIVMAVEMDYEAMSSAPTYTSAATVGDGYSMMGVVAHRMAIFLKNLGYQSVASGNDLSLSVPYAIQAGLGEVGRHGMLVTYKYGPRVRLCKVYTDLELVEYDPPATFGVREFCERCQRCSDACPAKAIPNYEKPVLQPHADMHSLHSNPGTEKWYVDCYKCFEYWCKSNTDCSICITSCPYNKPDFWHHRMVDKLTAMMPGPVHRFMRQMDIVFGYGNSFDPKAVKKFWSARNRKYLGYK
jgi:epoxyqueuosine reductase